MRRPVPWLVFTFPLAAVGCGGGGSEPPPPPPTPTVAVLAVVSGNDQVGETGMVLPQPLVVRAQDVEGRTIPNAPVTWSITLGAGQLSTTSTQTNAQGEASVSWTLGDAEGQQVVSAASGTAMATFNATAILPVPDDLLPNQDVDLGGQQRFGLVTIPEGVTVTVTSDLSIEATGDIEIAGTVVGDCVGIGLRANGSLTVSGSVTNRCTIQPGGTQPGISLEAAGAWTFDSATVETNGPISISNVIATPTALGTAQPTSAMGFPCRSARSNFSIFDDAPRGANGSPAGQPGGKGSSVSVRCSGDAQYVASRFIAQGGGSGGDGTSSAEGVDAVGGRGGDGGDVLVVVAGNLTAGQDLSSLTLIPGSGGGGGTATANGRNPVARGGDGGHIGIPRVIVGGTVTLFVEGLIFDYHLSDAGRGGVAETFGQDGADATSTTPAERGSNASSFAGDGGNLGGESTLSLIGGMLQAGSILNSERIVLRVAEAAPGGDPITANAGRGGLARARPGSGGNGSAEFKPGADAGTATAIGGDGGDANILDNRGGVFAGTPGDGGEAEFSGSGIVVGGVGGHMCMFSSVGPGGPGGNGGTAIGTAGQGGLRGTVREGMAGGVAFLRVLNGGKGGDGAGPGPGGAAGDDGGVVILNGQQIIQPVKQPGSPGAPCKFTYDVTTTVTSDPNGHDPFIGMTNVTMLMLTLGADGVVTFAGDPPWVELTGLAAPDGTFSVSGRGTVAGFPNVQVTFQGSITVDANGVPVGFAGTLTADGENAILPPNGMGERNPAVYNISAVIKSPL